MTKRAHQSTDFQTFECSNESSLAIPQANFETLRPEFIHVLHICYER